MSFKFEERSLACNFRWPPGCRALASMQTLHRDIASSMSQRRGDLK
jgi:hypothetical protein